MAYIGQNLEKKGVIMALLTLVLMNIGCEDKIDSPVVNPSEGKTVEVLLDLGFADEEDGTVASSSPASKADNSYTSQSTFDVIPVAGMRTKASGNIPDKLYNLDIIQYTSSGTIKSNTIVSQSIGADFSASVSLTPDTGSKLLLVARGNSSDFGALSGKKLSDVQAMTVKTEGSKINAISTEATGSDLANMPYYLLLEDVNITSDGKIQSPDGKDVRLLLKRLAVKIQLDWTINSSMTAAGYVLKEVKLCQAPAHYRLIPQTETTDKWGEIYPTSVAEFIDVYRLTGTDIENGTTTTNTVWIPANARGLSAYATSPIYRNKENANAAATYAEFVVDNSNRKERLYYRAYLGGNETNDFNLLENKNYHWTVKINNANYTNDPRIQLLDQTPVESSNLQPTANCFMMKPGTNICFNPYKHEAGTDGWNTTLITSGTIGKVIDRVGVIWQTKDAGTSGDLVMGYVVDDINHQNLVNLTNGSDINNARVHVKVPVTNGGNAVIAAYSGETIVWSWHIWISDYVPVGINNYMEYESAQQKTVNGTVHKYDSPLFGPSGVYAKMVIMDRDLGARKGGFPGTTIGDGFTTMDIVNTYGLLYQWGRKDPFFPSADGTNNETKVIYNGNGSPIGVGKTNAQATMQTAVTNPSVFYYNSSARWNNESNRATFWNADASMAPGKKTIYDPCPKGWKVPNMFAENRTISTDNIQANSIFMNFGQVSGGSFVYNTPTGSNYNKFLYYYNGNWYGSVTVTNSSNPNGGRLFLIGNTTTATKTIHNSVWIPANAERNGSLSYKGNLSFAGVYGHMWCADAEAFYLGFYNTLVQVSTYSSSYGWPVRCIQQ